MSLLALWFHYVTFFIDRGNWGLAYPSQSLDNLGVLIQHLIFFSAMISTLWNKNKHLLSVYFWGEKIMIDETCWIKCLCLNICVNILCLGSRGTRSSQIDSHSSSSNYHDSWETRSSYPERDRYPERDSRDQTRDSSFERRHGERDRRDNRERGLSNGVLDPFVTKWWPTLAELFLENLSIYFFICLLILLLVDTFKTNVFTRNLSCFLSLGERM